jgi:GAF domain-containing protein
MPHYFDQLASDKILPLNDVYSDPACTEISQSYCAQHGIQSMLDVPLRISGELAGVICFEETNDKRIWTG